MILVTGGTGLLGSHLLFELLKTERTVRVLYRNESKIQNVKLLFDYYSKGQETHNFHLIEWVKGDILDLVSLDDAFQDVTTVYHCAAMVSFRKADFKDLLKINREGTANMVNFALKYGVKKFGYVSSTATIGTDKNRSTEASKWVLSEKSSGYSISKYNAEREVWRGSEEGMDVVIINPSVIFGAGDLTESSLTIFNTVKKGLKFYSPGANAFVDARDVASCFVKLVESNHTQQRYLCLSENVPFKTILDTVAKEMKVKTPSILPPKWLAILIGRLNEFFSRFGGKSAITLESARTAYSTIRYSNEKIKTAVAINFYSLDESVRNVVNFYNWKLEIKK